MKVSKPVVILSILAGLLAAIEAGAGLFAQGGGQPFPFTTLHGKTVQMYGQGIYAYDTYFKAPILRGTDAITLFVVAPLLIAAVVLYRRGSLRGALLLAGTLSYLLYNAASIVFGAAYNNLFLLYVAYFSASLFAFILTFGAIDSRDLAKRIGSGSPRRGIAALMFVSAVALLFAWLGDIIGPLVQGGVPGIDSYTTEVTYAFDLGIIVPVCIYTGLMILRRAPVSYLLAAMMMVMLALVGLMVTSQTIFQMQAGIDLPMGQFIGKSGSFMVLALVSVWLIARLFQSIAKPAKR